MNDILKQLYDRFYTPLPMTEAEQEIEDCHKQAHRAIGKTREKTGAADHGYPESNGGGTLYGQFPLWISPGFKNGKRIELL